ncbi:hypothetical protein HH212_26145 [Massilia forsythiae]|uniref:DUF4214 domain-containing protein n=1 Tax=Massilia forsythiae TaxID=2728020 RepID=A0A7Z2ZV66_9BURK|nr:hypothetical protein [Massilia forsythiae]QJE03040.1 hypothetical protein HH212_26145 [Massilia forsythiae]
MPSGAVTVGGLVINLAAETSELKTGMADGVRTVDAGAKAMINSMVGVTESHGQATQAGARLVAQLQEEIATFGMTSQQLTQYKATLNGVGGEVETLMGRLNQMKAAQAGFTDQLAASEAQATARIRDMVAASMAEASTLNDVTTATQAATSAQAAAVNTGRTLAETQRLQILNMQGVAASMKAVQDGTVAMSADTQRILAQYDPLGAKLRALQADLALLRKEMGNSVEPAAIKAFQALEDEIAKTQKLMAQAAAQATAMGGATSQLTLTQTQLIDRFKQQADTIGMTRSQLMAYQAAQAGVTEQTRQAIAAVKAHEDAMKAAAKAKEEEKNATTLLAGGIQLLAGAYAALKVGEYVKDATMMAARYETLDVVMGVVGRTAGYTKTQMDAASEGVAKQGITMTESRNSVIKLVQAHIDLSNASALARIAQDAAVIGNINSSEAFERLVNGVARGNVLILRNIGINVNLQAAYAQMAASLGKSTLELTENERVQARLNAVLERGTDIAGTYEAAMDTASKQITSMKRYTEDLKTTFGEVFSETLTIAVMALIDGLKDTNGEISELAKNGQLADWGRELTSIFVGIANTVGNAYTTFQKLDTFARHLDARKAINADADAQSKAVSDSGNGMAEKGAVERVRRIESVRQAALAQENADYVAHQAELSGNFDRFERAANERMAARQAKQKKDADERLKVDQDYAARSQALLIANAGKSIEVQQAAQAKLAKEVYQGTPNFRDSEPRERKPKVDQADNTRMQDNLARIQREAAEAKQETEYLMKLDDMRHRAGEQSDAEFYENRKNNLDLLAGIEIAMYDQEIAALRAHHNSTEAEQEKTNKAINDLLGKQRAARRKFQYDTLTDEEEARLRTEKLYHDAYTATLGAGVTSIKALDDQIEKQKEHNAEIGKTPEQIELAKQAQVDLNTAQLKSDADYLRDGLVKWELDDQSRALFEIRLSNLDEEIARRKTLSGLLVDGANAEAGSKAAKEVDKYLDPTKADAFGKSLKGAIGGAADSMGKLIKAMQSYGVEQARNDKARAEAEVAFKNKTITQEQYLDDLDKINKRNTQNQMAGYGNLASAAAGFFGEHSRGYQSLMAVSQVFHAAELAMTTAELVPKAISAVLSQGQGDPYTAFGRMAAMAAVVAGLGVAIGGVGGANSTAADRQKSQGTGSVLGDSDAKSESIKKSLDLVEKNTYQGLAISSSMLASLRNIESSVASFASQLVRSTDIANPSVNLKAGAGSTTLAKADMVATGAEIGLMLGAPFVGALVGVIASKIPAVQKLYTSVFGGKQSVSDSGFSLNAASLQSILADGAKAFQYADITTSGGWFRKDKTSTQSNPLDDAANQQFTAIITSMADSIKAAGAVLGVSGDNFTAKLNSFVIDIGQVSLKGLSADEIQKALESVFSKLGDDMAQFAVGGLDQFQAVGEGYLETLARIASEYQAVDVVFASFDKTFDLVGMSSIAARDRLVQMAGGLDKFTSQGQYFLENFFSAEEQAASLQKRIAPILAQYGLSAAGEDAMKTFRDFVVGLDTTTEAGAQAYTTLMTVAPALKTIADANKDALQEQKDAQKEVLDERKGLQDKLDQLTMTSVQLNEKERAALDESNRALYDRIAALNAEKDGMTYVLGNLDNALSVLKEVTKRTTDELTKRIQQEKALADAIKSTLDSIDPPGSDEVNRKDAQAQIQAALATAKATGALPDADSLKKALSVLSKDSASQFSTYADYMKDLLTTKNDLAELGGLADDSLSVDQQQLDSLNEMLEAQERQIAILKGIDSTGLTIAQAMDGFKLALEGAKANPLVAATSAISSAYQTSLGRAADAGGMTYWQNQALGGVSIADIQASIAGSTEARVRQLYQELLGRPADAEGLQYYVGTGAPIDTIRDSIKQSAEYKALHPFAIGTNYIPEDMPAMVHKGERIIPAADNRALFAALASPAGNAEALAAAVDRLTATVATQQATIAQQSEDIKQARRDTKRMADTLERVTRGGNKMVTTTEAN